MKTAYYLHVPIQAVRAAIFIALIACINSPLFAQCQCLGFYQGNDAGCLFPQWGMSM